TSSWFSSRANGVGEILTLQVQRLNPVDVWNCDLTIAVRDSRVSVNIGSFIVNLEHLGLVCVIVNHHSLITNHRNSTNFTGMQPAYMDMRVHAIGKFKVEMGNIFDV